MRRGCLGFLQGLESLSDAFQWPAQLRQIVLLALFLTVLLLTPGVPAAR